MTPEQYWNSTLKEVSLYVEVYNEKITTKQKINASNIYNMAYLTTMFIGCSLSKKDIPTLNQIFPDLFEE